MSDLGLNAPQHGGQLGEGYGRLKAAGPDFSHGIALYLEKVSVWKLLKPGLAENFKNPPCLKISP